MARVLGRSQAWQSVLDLLGPTAVVVTCPDDLRQLVAQRACDQVAWPKQAETQVEDQLHRLMQQIEDISASIADQQQKAHQAVAPQIAALESTIANRSRHSNVLVRLYHRCLTIPGLRHRLYLCRRYVAEAGMQMIQQREACLRQNHWLTINFQQQVKAIVELRQRDLETLRNIGKSPELAGATAELELAVLLARLPDTYTVLNDVNLTIPRAIQFDGKWLMTAQCDHVVVGPTGVFVIECKRWSKAFVESGDGFDPFEQVGRARYMCQCILRDKGHRVTAHDVIANAGAWLPKPDGAFAFICAPEAVPRRIQTGRDSLNEREIAAIVATLTGYL